jgi:PAS domain S-box-containing protein
MYSNKFDDLRNKAEELLAGEKGPPKKLALEIDELIHELQIYQIELEMQNEELRTAQLKLKTSQIRYFEFYDLAPIGFYTLDTNGWIMDVNLTGATFLEVGKNRLINRPFTRFIAPDSRKKFSNHVKRIIDSGTNQQCEIEIIKNKSPVYVHIESKAFFDENWNIKEILISAIDITERKNTENERRESEEFLKNIVENIPNMIFIKSADKLNFEMVNKAGEELMGQSREELIGKTDYDFFPKDEADFFTQTDREVLQNKKLLDIPEETIENENLGQRILHTKKIPILNKEKNPQYLLNVSEDITERKIVEEQLKKSLAEKEVLLREIHHRVKNNLQIIASLLHLQEGSLDDEDLINILKESKSRVNSMAIIHETLYQSPNLSYLNFKRYLEKLVYDILYTYEIRKGIIDIQLDIDDINLNIDTAIPLGLIINELITNTVKYAFPQNEGTITIKLKSLPENIEITIADNGIGLPKDINLENPETLGLQLVQSLIGQLDGKLKLNKDNGTEFKITFKEVKYKRRM